MVAGAVTLGTDLLKTGLSLLGQHTARLHNAQSENAAVATVIDPFDQDVAEIVDAYNNGTASNAEVAQACANVNANIYSYMHSLVGKPGTAWVASVGMQGLCNKQCTAACCVYYGDLGPVLSMISVAVGGPSFGWGTSDPRYHANGKSTSIDVPEVFASKYGGRDRKGYSITLTPPAVVQSVRGTLEKSVTSLLGGGSSSSVLSNLGVGSDNQGGNIPTVGTSAGSSPLMLIVLVFLALLVGVSVLKA